MLGRGESGGEERVGDLCSGPLCINSGHNGAYKGLSRPKEPPVVGQNPAIGLPAGDFEPESEVEDCSESLWRVKGKVTNCSCRTSP